MGVGLSAQGVNMNRLPGWDKHSYGYHGDDGNSFCSSGTGQAYGPTFTTNDIIGKNVRESANGYGESLRLNIMKYYSSYSRLWLEPDRSILFLHKKRSQFRSRFY